MTIKAYLLVSGIFFFLVAGLHLARLVYQVPVQVGAWIAPVWMSFGGFIVPGILSVLAFRLLRNTE